MPTIGYDDYDSLPDSKCQHTLVNTESAESARIRALEDACSAMCYLCDEVEWSGSEFVDGREDWFHIIERYEESDLKVPCQAGPIRELMQ